MPSVKKLILVGDATGLVLDPVILRQVNIEPDSEVVSVEGSAIIIRPARYASDDNARAAGREVRENRRRLLDRLSK
jgi:antitoxin component of MazEF toxin-antitoxin module